MNRQELAILAFAVFCDCAWAVSLWRRWPEAIFRKQKAQRRFWLQWYWLSIFGIARTEQNCVRIARGMCIAGMILVTGFLLIVLLRLLGRGL